MQYLEAGIKYYVVHYHHSFAQIIEHLFNSIYNQSYYSSSCIEFEKYLRICFRIFCFISVLNLNKSVDFYYSWMFFKNNKDDGAVFVVVVTDVNLLCFIILRFKVFLGHKYTLESEEEQEGHHKTEKTHSFRKGETQDSVGQ